MGNVSKKNTIMSSAKKVNICPYLLYMLQLFFGELVTIEFVDILKVGSMDKPIW